MSNTIVRTLQNITGWRRAGAAFAFGLLAALAFPPFNLIPVLWLSFPALFFLLQGAGSKRAAFATGWSFAFGILTISLYWIAASMFVDIRSFWWALPFAVAGLPAFFAVYYGLAAVAAWRWGLTRVDGLFFFALCWFLADMARVHLFSGFPWDIMGYVWGDVLPVLQSTSVFGIEGLTLITLILAVLPACFVVCQKRRKVVAFVAAGLAVLVVMTAAGAWRLEQASTEIVPDVRLRLVQPRTSQAMKWKPEQRLANFQHLMMLSFAQPGEKPITHTIWPETAVAYYLTEEPEIRARIAEMMPKDSVLLTGVVRREERAGQAERYYNSLIALDSQGKVVAGYDKYHLVPFGEYMPFRSQIPLPVISNLPIDFTAGDGIRTIRVPHLPPFSGLVCYEAIFSNDVVDRLDPPTFLLNVTNDAWYDGTIGPAQHFDIARVRAIEEGLPLVRVANRGVTAVVDSYGRIISSLGAPEMGYVDSDLPQPLGEHTIMWRSRGAIAPIMSVILAFLLVVSRFRMAKRAGKP